MDTSQQTQTKRTQRQASSSYISAKSLNLTEVSVMEIETTESKSSESTEDVGCCRRTCQEIEQLVTEIDHFKTSRGQCNVCNLQSSSLSFQYASLFLNQYW